MVGKLGYGEKRLAKQIIKNTWNIEDPYSKKYDFNDLLYVFQEIKDEEGKKQYDEEELINRTHKIFSDFVKHIMYRNLANFDSMVLLTSDKGCLTDDTKIMMPRDLSKHPDGVPIKELINKGSIYVYSFNKDTKKLELKKSDGVEFAKYDDVYEIELITGQKIKATSDHPFMLMDGSFKQLSDLIWNKGKDKHRRCRYIKGKNIITLTDRLRLGLQPKFFRQEDSIIKIDYNKGRNYTKEHKFVWESINGPIQNNKIIHHKNGNHYDNRIENLELINREEHSSLHSKSNLKLINKFNQNFKNKKVINPNYINYGGVINNIKYIGKQNVYDIVNVRDNKNFIANGFVVSNTGKSSAAIMMARQWCKLLGIRFNPNRHLAYSNKDVMEKIDMLNPFEPLIADESVRFASSADWNKTESKELRKKLAEVRTKHLFFMLCFPLKIYKMEKTYLESFVNYWCVTGDTKILTRDVNGKIRNIPVKQLSKHKNEVLSYNIEKNIYEFKKYDKKIKTKKDAEIFELELENGLKIKCTNDHPFLTQRGWVRLKDLKETDSVEVKTKKCKWCKKDFLPKKQNQTLCSKNCSDKHHVRTKRQKDYAAKYRKKNKKYLNSLSNKDYYKNREERLKNAEKYRKENRDKINTYAKKYREENRELLRIRDKEYREKNYNRYRFLKNNNWRRYRDENINFKLRENLRNSMRRVLKTHQTKKTHPIFKYLGCSIEFFKKHIEEQFELGMSWKNWGRETWHIDHIIPCSHFDLTKESERIKCFNYKNLQPLWAPDNISKGDRYVG